MVSGRRRQGKSYLLEALCESLGGFYFAATEALASESLRRIGERIAAFQGQPAPFMFADWEEAIEALFSLGDRNRPLTVVIDEFPYLVAGSGELPSIVQAVFDRHVRRRKSKLRLILCGSAMSFMGQVLSGESPLRGRSSLDLVVQPFDYREAADFWGLSKHHETATLVNAVAGGRPAYRREFIRDDAPKGPRDFDAWICRTALDPATPLFREGRYLLAEEPEIRGRALYQSVLSAIARGNTTRAAISREIGRASDEIGHPLAVLEDAGFIAKQEDIFRRGRPTWQIDEPIVRFYHAILRPRWAELSARTTPAKDVWRGARTTFDSLIVGPHFERLSREWVAGHASVETLGGIPAKVGCGQLNDRSGRTALQVDVVVLGEPVRQTTPVLLVGEAKWGKRAGRAEITKLRRALELLDARGGYDTGNAKLALFAKAHQISPKEAERERIEIVDLDRLYEGS